jgi:hypothetical protein
VGANGLLPSISFGHFAVRDKRSRCLTAVSVLDAAIDERKIHGERDETTQRSRGRREFSPSLVSVPSVPLCFKKLIEVDTDPEFLTRRMKHRGTEATESSMKKPAHEENF